MRTFSLSVVTGVLFALTACGDGSLMDEELEGVESADMDSLERGSLTKIANLRDEIALLEERLAEIEDANCVTEEEMGELLLLVPYVEVDADTNDIRVVGANLHLQNGAGSSASVNGLGNLVIGYNETDGNQTRTGSHNVVVGPFHGYSSFNGMVVGNASNISAPQAVVVGGYGHTASGENAAVFGGVSGLASGFGSTAVGAHGSTATGWFSHVVGGYNSTSTAEYSSAVGGVYTNATGYGSMAVAGFGTTATGTYSFVSP